MMKKITFLALLAISVSGWNATAQSLRLTAVHRSYYYTQSGWTPYDSVQFKYPSNNGGTHEDFDGNVLKADSSYFLNYVSGNYQQQKIETKSFDMQGRIVSKIVHNYTNPDYTPSQRFTNTYDGNNNITEELIEQYNGGNWENYFRTVRTFDVNNNMISILTESWVNGSWQGSNHNVFTFDNDNNMLTYKSLIWNTGISAWDSNFYQHYYYTNNLEDSVYSYTWQAGWQPSQRYYCDYDMNGDNTHRIHQNWDANTSTWTNSLQAFTTYTNHLPLLDTTMDYPEHLGNWRYKYRYGYTYNADWNMLTYYYQDWDTTGNVFVNNILDSSTFNGLHKTNRTSYTWNAGTNSYGADDYDAITNYYYEPYTADVRSVQQDAGDLTIYPVPARNHLNIDMKWNKAQDFTIAIYDMQGRLIRQTGEKATKDFRKSIPLAGIAAGTYILTIRGKDATVQEQFVIMD